jgi:LmbE family N-acetylglucosaminyl deacetylase
VADDPGAAYTGRRTMDLLAEHGRFERYDAIYISPHLDDAVYSCAGRIAQQRRAGKRVLVVTMFGDGARDPVSQMTGRFADFQARREEDRAALTRLDADYAWFNHPDLVFRRPTPSSLLNMIFPFLKVPASALHREMSDELRALCARKLAEGGRVWFPFAVGFHPDHRIVFDVGHALHAEGVLDIEFYEDVPYALAPVLVALRLRYLGVPARAPLLRSASELNNALFRYFNLLWLTYLPTLLYLLVLLGLQSVLRHEDRFAGEPSPARLPDLAIDDVIDEKVAAVRLYPTQTELFLAMDERLYQLLRGDNGYVERSWRFPAFSRPSERLRRISGGI